MTNRYEELESELDTLDIPALSADTMIDAICATLELDPIEMIDRFDANPQDSTIPPILRTLIFEVIETSTQIPHIRRALEIGAEMIELDD